MTRHKAMRAKQKRRVQQLEFFIILTGSAVAFAVTYYCFFLFCKFLVMVGG